jgi:competence protein ComEC
MKRILALAIVAACAHPKPPLRPVPPPAKPIGNISWKHVDSPVDVSREPPPAGTYRVHLIDVGTGLAILVQGHDFNLLYDGGTNDAGEKPLRVVSYLSEAIGPSGDSLCVPKHGRVPEQRLRLDHVVLSHPHADHGSALDLVVHCYDVANVWDSGRVNDAVFYRDFLTAVGSSLTAQYHTAASVPDSHTTTVKGTEIKIPNWTMFREQDVVELGEGARFEILHAEGKKLSDANQNSVVIAVTLGTTRLLLVGDAESGERKDPSYPAGDVEAFLVEHHASRIRADILQVGHHGSKTSSRHAFLSAVKPKLALVSTGPKRYGPVRLPDPEVIEALGAIGAAILRTDLNDEACPVRQRIGGDSGPGGCDSYIITIGP